MNAKARACNALCDAGSVMETSRWSSERGERTPPDPQHHRLRPGGCTSILPRASGTPSGVRSSCGGDPVVFAQPRSTTG